MSSSEPRRSQRIVNKDAAIKQVSTVPVEKKTKAPSSRRAETESSAKRPALSGEITSKTITNLDRWMVRLPNDILDQVIHTHLTGRDRNTLFEIVRTSHRLTKESLSQYKGTIESLKIGRVNKTQRKSTLAFKYEHPMINTADHTINVNGLINFPQWSQYKNELFPLKGELEIKLKNGTIDIITTFHADMIFFQITHKYSDGSRLELLPKIAEDICMGFNNIINDNISKLSQFSSNYNFNGSGTVKSYKDYFKNSKTYVKFVHMLEANYTVEDIKTLRLAEINKNYKKSNMYTIKLNQLPISHHETILDLDEVPELPGDIPEIENLYPEDANEQVINYKRIARANEILIQENLEREMGVMNKKYGKGSTIVTLNNTMGLNEVIVFTYRYPTGVRRSSVQTSSLDIYITYKNTPLFIEKWFGTSYVNTLMNDLHKFIEIKDPMYVTDNCNAFKKVKINLKTPFLTTAELSRRS